MIPSLTSAAIDGLKMCAPVLGIICLAAILAPLVLGGWSFSTEALMPQFSRLNPLEGVKRMFSMRAVIELVKTLAKFGIVGLVAVFVLWNDVTTLLNLGQEPLHQAIAHTISLSGKALIAITSGLLIIAGIDVPYQLYTYAKQLKMSRQEIREEHKESEGSPEVKGRIRQLQQQMARQRMMQDVPKADVIVTNPTHFAVALRYDEGRMRAPIVVAKGADLIAARIREIAAENNVPIFEAPPLARVLYKNVDIGGEIPSAVYQAVAQVLTYVFQLRVAKRSGFQPPPRPDVTVEE
jgi:flagellar biosynthetic protein FlhB